MRAALHILAVAALALIWALTIYTIYGPHALPASFPVHFESAGRPNGWGRSAMLWALPAVASVLYGLMTLVARFPSSFNFPVRVTRENRGILESTALSMIAWLRFEVVGLFAWIQSVTVRFAREGQGNLSPLFLPVILGIVFLTIVWHVAAMLRAGGRGRISNR